MQKKIKESPNDLNAMNEAFNHLKTELERVSDDERFKGFGGNLTSLYADLKDKIHHNALSDDELDRIIAFRGQEFEKNLEGLMPSSLGVHSYKVPFESLLNKVLNNKDLSVKYAQVDPNDPKKEIFITDEEQSNLARQKAEELKEAFKDWIYKDYARRTHLEQIYNDTFNNSVLKTYDGSQLELEGFNHHISLRPPPKERYF